MARIDLLLDTDVLIRAWRGDAQLVEWLDEQHAGIDTIARLEFLQGANKRQAARALKFIEKFDFVPFSPEVSLVADRLIRQYSHAKGLRLGDALMASTALVEQLPLYSFNTRHFDFIEGLTLV